MNNYVLAYIAEHSKPNILSEIGDPRSRVDAVVLAHGAVLAAHERTLADRANLNRPLGRVGRHATGSCGMNPIKG